MSDLANRNALAAQATLERVSAQYCELKNMVTAQNAKIQTLTVELAKLKQKQIMAAVEAQVAERGHGGTAT